MNSPDPDQLPDEAKQDIRIAVVLNGGVSLAIWMSGVTLELHHLALSSRGVRTWAPYRRVLEDLLSATVRIDVITGTSAGGLNGAFLALGLVRQRDLTRLRDLWKDSGALENLLRRPLEKNPPSLLNGDGYFLPQVTQALEEIKDSPQLVDGSSADPVELILTGTLWTGRETTFTDDMGVGITERDHDALFRFSNETRPQAAPCAATWARMPFSAGLPRRRDARHRFPVRSSRTKSVSRLITDPPAGLGGPPAPGSQISTPASTSSTVESC